MFIAGVIGKGHRFTSAFIGIRKGDTRSARWG